VTGAWLAGNWLLGARNLELETGCTLLIACCLLLIACCLLLIAYCLLLGWFDCCNKNLRYFLL
jgi:hypothetical protein